MTTKTTEKKPRSMSPKGFLHKTTLKAANSAIGFLAAYKEYLLKGEVSYATAEIMEKVDSGELLPTPALAEIKQVVLAHIIESDRIKAEESIEKSQNPSDNGKPFIAIIFDSTGSVCTRVKDDGEVEELVKRFDLPQQAERWIDRRLFDGCVDWEGEIHNHGKLYDAIARLDSIARILKKPGRPALKAQKRSTSRLGFGVKASQDRSHFSHG